MVWAQQVQRNKKKQTFWSCIKRFVNFVNWRQPETNFCPMHSLQISPRKKCCKSHRYYQLIDIIFSGREYCIEKHTWILVQAFLTGHFDVSKQERSGVPTNVIDAELQNFLDVKGICCQFSVRPQTIWNHLHVLLKKMRWKLCAELICMQTHYYSVHQCVSQSLKHI